MREALDVLLRLNLAAGAAVLAVLLLRAPVRRLFGARIAYGLWSLVPLAALAMLVPARMVVIPRPSPDETVVAAPLSWAPTTALRSAASPSLAHIPAPTDLVPWVAAVWIAGVVLALAALWRSQARFERAIRDGLAGPAVVGVLRPRIVTPQDFETAYTCQERRMVLAHEATHIARQDSRINALAALLRCLNWFNPLIWLMARGLRIDQEFACDAAVMARYPRARRAYGEALLKTQLAAHPLPLGCYWPPEAVHPLVARIDLLARPQIGAMTQALGLTALGFVVLGGAGAVWAGRPPQLAFSPSHEAVVLQRAVRLAPPPQVADGRAVPRPDPRPA
ncbi:MAG: hypothetical protein JSS35_12800, partial [Proteobacteria bacterium]|nr:hypothetical protein [Pseudomonadota bacterium]